MQEVRVDPPVVTTQRDGFEISSRVDFAGKPFDFLYRTAAWPLNLSAEPFLAATLVVAMKLGAPLRMSGPVSPTLLGRLSLIQEVLHGFFPGLQPVSITAEAGPSRAGEAPQGVAAFFSGGLDSFYTVLRHLDEIDTLIVVHGYDIRLGDTDVWDRIAPSLRAAAGELGKNVLELGTNVQEMTAPYLAWNDTYGSAMASAALLLAPLFRKIYIPAGFSYAHMFPWSSHPLLDPLWSTDEMEIVHDGCEAMRVDKAALISTSATALKYLRVCYQNRNEQRDAYNCGRCEKCIRTKINLLLVGALDRCATFDNTLDLEAVARLPIHPDEVRPFIEDNLEAAERLGAAPELILALRRALDRPQSDIKQESEVAQVERTIRDLQQDNADLRATIRAIQASRSWLVAAPLRALGDAARGLRSWIDR